MLRALEQHDERGAHQSSVMRTVAFTVALAASVTLALASPAAAGGDQLPLLSALETAYARVQAYTARFVRQEVVDGALRPREEALLKFQRPGLIYLRWTAGPPAGREILFVPGLNDNQMLVREPGLLTGFATIVMAPDSPRVLEESRHPVTDIGLGRLIDLILDNARRATAAGELTVHDLGGVAGPDGPERRIEALLPRARDKGYYCYRLLLAIAAESGLPVRAVIYDWDDRVVADYAYRELRLNPPLTPADFDESNPGYGFPRWRLRVAR
jgi:outer membrane lipoprotein-sorting protein